MTWDSDKNFRLEIRILQKLHKGLIKNQGMKSFFIESDIYSEVRLIREWLYVRLLFVLVALG